MPIADEYRKTAEEYDRLAREADNETDRLALLDLAQSWLDAASRHNERTPEQIAAAQKMELDWQPTPKPRRGWRRW
ncbi:MAG: hypothetical protein WA652_20085, partial [Xanthobacteraceae bacterium]